MEGVGRMGSRCSLSLLMTIMMVYERMESECNLSLLSTMVMVHMGTG